MRAMTLFVFLSCHELNGVIVFAVIHYSFVTIITNKAGQMSSCVCLCVVECASVCVCLRQKRTQQAWRVERRGKEERKGEERRGEERRGEKRRGGEGGRGEKRRE